MVMYITDVNVLNGRRWASGGACSRDHKIASTSEPNLLRWKRLTSMTDGFCCDDGDR